MSENVLELCYGERKKGRGGERESRGAKVGREGEGERRKMERGGDSDNDDDDPKMFRKFLENFFIISLKIKNNIILAVWRKTFLIGKYSNFNFQNRRNE